MQNGKGIYPHSKVLIEMNVYSKNKNSGHDIKEEEFQMAFYFT